jgi:ABC-2 type transport system ATP-binding protein
MEETFAIKTEGLVKFYGKTQALFGVDLEVEQGEIMGFLGPNGAGKTTTIRCLLDLIRPQEGNVSMFGLDPFKDPVDVRKMVGYLPGELNLETNMKPKAQLKYYAELRSNSIDWNYVRELAKKIQLDLNTPIKTLSKGNKQKIGVLQALMHKPKLLIMDEPTSGLDPLIQQEVYKLLKEARENGATVFFSSHIIGEVEALADRVAIIRGGRIIEEANPSQLKLMTMRQMRIRFKESVDLQALDNIEGVELLHKMNGVEATLQIKGDLDKLIKKLAEFPVSDIEIMRPSLEEIFLKYYKEDQEEAI